MTHPLNCVFTFGIKSDPHTRGEAVTFACLGVGSGWHPLLRCLIDKLDFYYETFRIGQVKEKFGGLRFYGEGMPRQRPGYVPFDAEQAIDLMGYLSYYICEQCGKPGECGPTRPGGYWVATLCRDCRGRVDQQ